MHVFINAWRDLTHEHSGGSEVLIDRLAQGLVKRGHRVTLRAGGPLARHEYATIDGGGTFDQYLRTPRHLRRASGIDVVVDVNNGVGYYTPLFSDIPTVSMVHHLHTEQWSMFFPRPVAAIGRIQESWALPRAYRRNLFVVPSLSTGQRLVELGVRADRVRILPMAVSHGVANPPATKASEPLFLALGRVAAHKRIGLLLDMWGEVRPLTGGRLVIAGDGPDLARHSHRTVPGVEFRGRISEAEKEELLSQAWILVHAAAWEGWGMVLTEAALLATPSIGFDVAGVRDAIDPGYTGMIAADSQGFTDAWIKLSADHELRQRLGAQAHQWAHSRDTEDQVGVLEEALYEAVDHAVGTGPPRDLPVLGRGSAHHPGPTDVRSSLQATKSERPPTIRLSIVVPAYNEAERIPWLLEALAEGAVDVATTEVIIVDDGSDDETSAIAQRFIDTSFPHGHVIRLSTNRGKGAALRAGMTRVRGESVMMMDADMATDLEALAPMLAALDTHHVAIGSRRSRASTVLNGALHRKVMALGLNRMVQSMTAVNVRDTQCGFKAFRGPVAKLLFHCSMADGFGQDAEVLDLAHGLGLRIAEVPVVWTAVPGSKIRLLRDSLQTIVEVAAHWSGVRSVPLVAGLRLSSGDRPVDVMVKEVLTNSRRTDAVLDDGQDVHVILPGADVREVELIADRLAHLFPEANIERWSCTFDRFSRWQAGTALSRIGAASL